MSNINTTCPRCGSEMKQSGSDHNKVHYHCPSCSYDMFIEMSTEDNAEYWQMRSNLLERVAMGVIDWKVTNWDGLMRDLISFIGRNEDARLDVRLQTGILACFTKGFHDMNDQKYKECKAIFKATEKMYKKHMKALEATLKEFPNPEDVAKYQEYRVLYKKLRDEFRNTKLLWKLGFTVGKKLFLWWLPM